MPRHEIRNALILLLLLLAGLIPYPTQVFPNITIQIVDTEGPNIPTTIASWRGQTNTASFEGQAPFDATGRLTLPPRTAWVSAYQRIYQGTGIPHKLHQTYASVSFRLPPGHTVDFAATGVMELPTTVWSPLREHGPLVQLDSAAAERGGVDLTTFNPTRTPATPIRIVLRKLPATIPTLYRNPPNPHF